MFKQIIFMCLLIKVKTDQCAPQDGLTVLDKNIQHLVKQSFIFYDMKNFINLTLPHNNITTITKDCFSGMYKLQYLSLQDNKIEELYEEIFEDNRALIHVNLINNRLTRIEKGIFKNLYDLQALLLARNKIDFIASGAFEDLKNLKELNLAENRLTLLYPETFLFTKKLATLNLNRNKIQSLANNTFSELSNLETLLLDGNHLNEINLFTNLRKLENLVLSNNKIEQIEPGTFDKNIYLNILVLEANRIQELPDDLFNNSQNLQYLSVGQNSLRKIGRNVFPLSLIHLELNENKLEYLNIEELENKANLTGIYLHKNPWNCSCELKKIIEFYVSRTTAEDTYIPECYSPDAVLNKPWTRIEEADFTCEHSKHKKRESPLKLISDELRRNCSENCVAQTNTLRLLKPRLGFP